jgi:hypothetical protein
MNRNTLLALLTGTLIVGAGTLWKENGGGALSQAWWIGFLVLMPLGLVVLVWWDLRWAAMVCVIYATVGLALDVATTVQILTKDTEVLASLMGSLVSGLLNFLLIVFGGRSFLNVPPAPPPLRSRPPNPGPPS